MSKSVLIPIDAIQNRILLIRGQRVMMDYDLADLYEVEAKALNQAVKRNLDRFPEDFMFQLTCVHSQAHFWMVAQHGSACIISTMVTICNH